MNANTAFNTIERSVFSITGSARPPGGESGRMNLAELITTRKRDLAISYSQMMRKAEEAGFPISRSMFHHFTGETIKNIPTTESLQAIAAAIAVDPDEVLAAAAESIGITTRDLHLDRGARAVLAMLENRTPEQVAALEAVVRTVTRAMDASLAEPEEDVSRT